MSGINTRQRAREGGRQIPETVTPRKKRSRREVVDLDNDSDVEIVRSGNYSVKRAAKRPRLADKVDNSNLDITVGIDFGTTYSGAALVLNSESDHSDVREILDWPGGATTTASNEKMPSRIAFDFENSNRLRTHAIGYEVKPDMNSCSWMKLHFDENAPEGQFDDPLLRESAAGKGLLRLPPDMTAVAVVAEYLKFIYTHIMKRMEREFTKEAVQVSSIKWHLTVPAMFSEAGKDAIRAAALKAGITTARGRRNRDTISLIPEPEAAAIAALASTVQRSGGVQFEVNTCTLIADCGGGTADLISYKITRLEPHLKLDEAAPGTGGYCGSTAIDRAFHGYMINHFGDVFSDLSATKIGPNSRLMQEFEIIKKNFSATNPGEIFRLRLALPNLQQGEVSDLYYDFDEGEVLLSSDDLKEMFEEPVRKILGLVDQQLASVQRDKTMPEVETIVLCGGFGSSPFLFNRLEAFCDGKGIRIICPDRAWSAIARGAAMRGLNQPFIGSVKCRAHYGIAFHQEFREGIDNEADSFICAYSGQKRAGGYVEWLAQKGESIKRNTVKNLALYHVVESGDDTAWEWDLYYCDLDTAPKRVDDPGVQLEGNIVVDTSRMPSLWGTRADRRTTLVSGDNAIKIDVKVKLVLGGDRGTLEVSAIVKGRTCGTASIRYARGGVARLISVD